MSEWKCYWNDRLVIRAKREPNELMFKGKRVGNSCPLTHEERREYVEKGAVAAVALIKTRRKCDLRTALDLLNKARGGEYCILKQQQRRAS